MSITMAQFLKSHGLQRNPFIEEEAQNDKVFEDLVNEAGYAFNHQAWDKFFGDPPGRGTSMIFGVKGSGKSALRLALEKNIAHFNREHPERILLINYDDFNGFLEAFKRKSDQDRKRETAVTLKDFGLAQHLDAILVCGMEALLSELKEAGLPLDKLEDYQRHDLMMLMALYVSGPPDRYNRIMAEMNRRLLPRGLFRRMGRGIKGTLVGLLTLGVVPLVCQSFYGAVGRAAEREILVRSRGAQDVKRALRPIPTGYLKDQDLKRRGWRDDADRRRLFMTKFIDVVLSLDFQQIVVVMDKIDEPSLINGDRDRMEAFVWPLWNNRILQLHPNLSFKMLLPRQLYEAVRKAGSEKANEARFDKQKIIYPFRWGDKQLYDMMSGRLRICRDDPSQPYSLDNLFDDAMPRREILAALDRLRQPRFVLNYLYRLIAETCAHTDRADDSPVRIQHDVFYQVTATIGEDIKQYYQTLGESPE
ncbi:MULTISPECIES: hypothetical protein [Thiorhodovibrio]|jgi:hypothetical protein|uniref:hypothetical protein n=1 Tax=Thiorhodovibrio TaxID=61593 RepID=UPI0019139314|nr:MULTISPECIES: hypothetical protein [Thiorhodovibrio]MBK5968375.1 hypothetical protein [Thiorhodovibrio winogradskyi]WPL13173.1 hypothetical protein Thiosp_02967 [Thiorhodovibrio litoralis]